MDIEKYLPSLISLTGVIFTVLVSLWLGLVKQRMDTKSADFNADAGIRDDLIEINANLNTQLAQREEQIRLRDDKIDKRDQTIAQLQNVIAQQLTAITDLTLEAKQREYAIKEKDLTIMQLNAEIEKFTRKVYYVRETLDNIGERHEP